MPDLEYVDPAMLMEFANWTRRSAANLFAAGIYANSYGNAPSDEGFGEILGTSLLGGFVGMVGGLILTQILRYISFVTGRNLGGHTWTVVGTVVGMAAFALMALMAGED
jgi:predicted membrane protein